MKRSMKIIPVLAACLTLSAVANDAGRTYELWEPEPAPNLWTLHPPFQIDGSLGTMAGVSEMLLQSHDDEIKFLPAFPAVWNDGHFDGLLARGNFVISAKWKDGKATEVSILSRSGGECRMAYPGIGNATVTDSRGKKIKISRDEKDRINFASVVEETYTVKTI